MNSNSYLPVALSKNLSIILEPLVPSQSITHQIANSSTLKIYSEYEHFTTLPPVLLITYYGIIRASFIRDGWSPISCTPHIYITFCLSQAQELFYNLSLIILLVSQLLSSCLTETKPEVLWDLTPGYLSKFTSHNYSACLFHSSNNDLLASPERCWHIFTFCPLCQKCSSPRYWCGLKPYLFQDYLITFLVRPSLTS